MRSSSPTVTLLSLKNHKSQNRYIVSYFSKRTHGRHRPCHHAWHCSETTFQTSILTQPFFIAKHKHGSLIIEGFTSKILHSVKKVQEKKQKCKKIQEESCPATEARRRQRWEESRRDDNGSI